MNKSRKPTSISPEEFALNAAEWERQIAAGDCVLTGKYDELIFSYLGKSEDDRYWMFRTSTEEDDEEETENGYAKSIRFGVTWFPYVDDIQPGVSAREVQLEQLLMQALNALQRVLPQIKGPLPKQDVMNAIRDIHALRGTHQHILARMASMEVAWWQSSHRLRLPGQTQLYQDAIYDSHSNVVRLVPLSIYTGEFRVVEPQTWLELVPINE